MPPKLVMKQHASNYAILGINLKNQREILIFDYQICINQSEVAVREMMNMPENKQYVISGPVLDSDLARRGPEEKEGFPAVTAF